MTRFHSLRQVAYGIALGGAVLAAGALRGPAALAFAGGDARRGVTVVTPADVAASNAKIEGAYGDLADLWTDALARRGARFATPDLVRYHGAAPSACGVMSAGNAAYCIRDNSIYYDERFVAAQAKSAAERLGTDGDMAAVGVIAHEMGHAVAMQLGHLSRFTYDNESVADCLAGAFARAADDSGRLEPGDVDEAFYGMATAADPAPQLTGDRRVDRAILVRAALMGHGSQQQRMSNFQTGLDGGPGACLAELR
jgi:predicted metalloprotease